MAPGAKAADTEPSFFEALYAAHDADAHQVAPGIFLGAANAADDRQAMQKRGISHVLIVHPALPEKHPKHFKYKRLLLADEPACNLLELLPGALAFLGEARRANRGIFVHCAKGISRSSAVVIALLMLERGIGFDEAWKVIEQKRPIVYPNVGFQIQLRHLEKLLGAGELGNAKAWAEKLRLLGAAVPRGSLSSEGAPLQIPEAISSSMHEALDEVETLTERIFGQPTLLQQREYWKRPGLYFENLHKYCALPRDRSLLGRARAVSDKLATLPKVFSDALKGVKLGLGVAKQIDLWINFAEPKLGAEAPGSPAATPSAAPALLQKPSKILGEEYEDGDSDGSDSSSEGQGRSKKKKKKKGKKDKKSKKETKKIEKAVRKAGKLAAQVERAAREAEDEARRASQAAEKEADKANELDWEISVAEADEAKRVRKAGGAYTGGSPAKRGGGEREEDFRRNVRPNFGCDDDDSSDGGTH